jgi:hypothetical protein
VAVFEEKRICTWPTLLTKEEKAPFPLKERALHFQLSAAELSPAATHVLEAGWKYSNLHSC